MSHTHTDSVTLTLSLILIVIVLYDVYGVFINYSREMLITNSVLKSLV